MLLLPDTVDDSVDPDNPGRFIDAFVDSLDLAGAGFERAEPKETPAPGVRSRRLAEAVHLRVSEPGAVQPLAGGGDPPQPGGDLAVAPPAAELQDPCRFPAPEPGGVPGKGFRDFVKGCQNLERFGGS